ncbi:general stress protein [Mycetocola sp.]|uniref:general stress protein n=1 Tax=Mycetocola sp. TaxID=1871042 RepID=UPI003988D75C
MSLNDNGMFQDPAMPAAPGNAATGAMRELAVYPDYEGAQRAVDYLSDQKFPVEYLQIVGHGVKTVEIVAGRMTKGRAALAGAASGAWFGVLIGLLLGIFTPGAFWLSLILVGLLFGALWGAVFGFVGHWATRGKRDFASTRTLVADRYAVMVDSGRHLEAERLLADLR